MYDLIAILAGDRFTSFWETTLSITGLFLILDALIMSRLKGPHRAERSHYALCMLSIAIYLAIFPLGSEIFRQYWMQIITGFYIFDLCIIARDWRQLKPSYRSFYAVHHGASMCLFTLWHYTFIPFTDAMAIGALMWLSSDIWRWSEQLWRLNGYAFPRQYRKVVDHLERAHRLIAYGVFLWLLDFSFSYRSEFILLASGIIMDAIDTYFVKQTRSHKKPVRKKSNPAITNEIPQKNAA